jgi:mRNA-degrading endonuclease RelE of RelBE toxin-antitoxin system
MKPKIKITPAREAQLKRLAKRIVSLLSDYGWIVPSGRLDVPRELTMEYLRCAEIARLAKLIKQAQKKERPDHD